MRISHFCRLAAVLALGMSVCLGSSVIAQTATAPEPKGDESAPVTLVVMGNKLIVSSEDRGAHAGVGAGTATGLFHFPAR